eukprot:m51a1_g2410 hypothetical protein (524) ;mRNA; f:788419-790240
MGDAGDLISLALSFAAGLCSPCYLRLLPLLPYPAGFFGTPFETLVVTLCQQETSSPLEQLVRHCPGLCAALHARHPYGGYPLLTRLFRCASRCPCCPFARLRLLALLPGMPEEAVAAAAPGALVGACEAGGARAADFARELASAPFSAHSGPQGCLTSALRMACLSGAAEAVGVLGAAPYSLGHEQAVLPRSGKDREPAHTAFDDACSSPSVAVVDVLGRPPFSVCRGDILANNLAALVCACSAGRADTVARLSRPPFSLGQSEAIQCRALDHGSQSAAVLDALASSPYSLTGDHCRGAAGNALSTACCGLSAEAVRRLALPPYSLGHSDAIAANGVQSVCSSGCAEILSALAGPPYSLTRADVDSLVPRDLLATACQKGHSEVVRRLAQPPYCIGISEVRAGGYDVIVRACGGGHASVMAELAKPPFCIGQEEAREAQPFCLDRSDALRDAKLCLFSACLSGNVSVVRALSEPPYSLQFDPDSPDSISQGMSAIAVYLEFLRSVNGVRPECACTSTFPTASS